MDPAQPPHLRAVRAVPRSQVAITDKERIHWDLPAVLLFFLLFLGGVRPERLVPGLEIFLSLPTYLLGVLFLLWLASSRKVTRNPQTKYYFGFVLLTILGTLFARNSGFALLITKPLVITFLGYLCTTTFLNTSIRVERYIQWRFYLSVVPALIALSQRGKVMTLPLLEDENDFALFINIMLPFAFFLGQAGSTIRQKLLPYSLGCLLLVAHAASLSRGGFLGLLVVVAYCWFWTTRKLLTTVLLVGGLASMVILSPPKFLDELKTILPAFQDPDADNSAENRIYSWKVGWKMFLDHPIIGVGPANYGIWFPVYEPSGRGQQHWGRVPHSLYITLLAEHGVVGVILFLLVLSAIIRDHSSIIARYKRYDRLPRSGEITGSDQRYASSAVRFSYFMTHALMCSLLAYLVTGLFISVFHYGYFWHLTAILVALTNCVHRMADRDTA